LTANLKLIDKLIVSPDTPTMASSADWLYRKQETSGLKQRLIAWNQWLNG